MEKPTDKDINDIKTISRHEVEIEYLKKGLESAEKVCDNCIVRKVVYGIITVMGLAVMAGLLALVIRK